MKKTVDGVSTTIVFEYNENGLRTKKTVTVGQAETVTEYVLHGKNVVHLTRGTDELHFYYDAQGNPAVVVYNGTAYGYLYNLQGDVVALVDGMGAKVVEYTYDAWGKPTSKTGSLAETLGTVQPFRYRGYVFDEETGLYYLRSRYPNRDYKDDNRMKWVSAHEFGHVLGLYDYYKVPQGNPRFKSIMNKIGMMVSDHDVENLLKIIDKGERATW